MVAAKLYVEGGGDSKALKIECREAFRRLLDKAGLAGRLPRIVASGGRAQALDDFANAFQRRAQDEQCFLLIDSEVPVARDSPWEFLETQGPPGWVRPRGVADEHCHLMVQCMEAWFLADKSALEAFFGAGFSADRLPANLNVEAVSKLDVFSGLDRATRECRRRYDKGENSFKVLARIDVRRLEVAASWAKRFIDTLRRLLP
jgi:hypothetical protein